MANMHSAKEFSTMTLSNMQIHKKYKMEVCIVACFTKKSGKLVIESIFLSELYLPAIIVIIV